MSAPPTRKARVARRIGFGLPLALVLLLCVLMQPEPGSVLAPAFGPWAGLLYGHSECTMASVFPAVAIALLALGVACLLGIRGRLPGVGRALALWATGLWAVAWELNALLSVVNTTS